MKYLYFIIVLILYSYISIKAEPNMSDTLKLKKDTIQQLRDFEQKTDAFYIKQNVLKNQIEFQNFKLDSIIKQKPVKKFNKTKWVK